MKKLVLIPALFFGAFAVKNANAQIGLHVNLHLGGLHAAAVIPVVPPAQVVDEPVCADDYYYYPEVEAYYSVPEHCYYYQDNYGEWISAAYLPGRYHDFDWRTARRVEIRGARPYAHHDIYRARYGGWPNRNDYYARAFPGRDRDMPNPRFDRNDHREWNGPRDNGYGRGWNGDGGRNDYGRGDRDNNAYNNPGRNQGGYGQPDQNRGPQNGNGQGWNGNRNQNPNQGGYGQDDQNRGQQNQNRGGNYGQGQQGGFGQGQNNHGGQGQQDGQSRGGQSQDQNQGGRDRGGFSGGQYTQHGMGVINSQRSTEMAMSNRPGRL